MKPKIRIQLLTPDLQIYSDRLVDQYSELLAGPPDTHKGPLRIEFFVDSPKAVDEIKQYLDKIVGNIELSTPKIRKSQAGRPETVKKEVNPMETFLEKVKKAEFQEDVITIFKRGKFSILSQTVSNQVLKKTLRERDKDFNFWAERTHIDLLDPSKDTYNFDLIIGLKYVGDKVDKIIFYTNLEFSGFVKKPWKVSSSINFKVKKKGIKFPKQMSLDERKDWRSYDKKIKEGKSLKPLQEGFYNKWKNKVDELNSK